MWPLVVYEDIDYVDLRCESDAILESSLGSL